MIVEKFDVLKKWNCCQQIAKESAKVGSSVCVGQQINALHNFKQGNYDEPNYLKGMICKVDD